MDFEGNEEHCSSVNIDAGPPLVDFGVPIIDVREPLLDEIGNSEENISDKNPGKGLLLGLIFFPSHPVHSLYCR